MEFLGDVSVFLDGYRVACYNKAYRITLVGRYSDKKEKTNSVKHILLHRIAYGDQTRE